MRKRELDRFRQMLEERRRELLDKSERTAGEGRNTISEGGEDYVDDAVTSYTREFLLSLSGFERRQLALVEDALARIEDGTYGECQMCGESVPAARLKAIPWARYCVSCQEVVEKEGEPEEGPPPRG
jgi:DnaK suppressor protein